MKYKMLIIKSTKKWKNLKYRLFSNIKFEENVSCFKKNKSKFEKNIKFREELYKYHYEQYIDNVNSRPDLYLKDSEDNNIHDKRLKRNIPFVYSNEVKNLEELKKNPLTLVNVKNMNDESFGVATFNPYSLISARIINQNSMFSININFFIEKIKNSLLWRNKISKNETDNIISSTNHNVMLNTNSTISTASDDNNNANENIHEYPILNSSYCYRLINSEGDNIPGLIIDRYDEYISVQHLTLGCEMLACNINDAIIELLKPKGIIFRNDNKERLNEKLEIYKKVIYGKVPDKVTMIENNCSFFIDLINSPNTGWFFNRKNLRNYICHYSYQKNVLDLFSYVGSFGIQCSKIGKAKKVVCVEKDKNFVHLAKKSANLNNVNNIDFICSDSLSFLKNCNQLFDIIILDPPNLIPKSQFIESGSMRYINLINLAQNYVTPNGLLLIIFTTKLCSYQDYINIINKSFINTNKTVKIVGQGRSSPDNPVNLSLYLFSDFYWFILQLTY
ncbi:conserved Plasmodium protein, unknown function [Plasmodium gallinaceum]|uniref:Uncharacterized protein n=1 Tax=Plasmodium gallinaceum TaxID=5849 RepID=A0A1J1GX00_PLAGA|nr:conserved Plasmodium protein, unknown function [Plasmodium gallinaceum]CRG97091.1 conserved Plasmodium protein, unknown function [Plasmodium gallinaceum]